MPESMLGLTRPMRAAWSGVRVAFDDLDLPLATQRALDAAHAWDGWRRFPHHHCAFTDFFLTDAIPECMALVVVRAGEHDLQVYLHPTTWEIFDGGVATYERTKELRARGEGLHWLDGSSLMDAALAMLFTQEAYRQD